MQLRVDDIWKSLEDYKDNTCIIKIVIFKMGWEWYENIRNKFNKTHHDTAEEVDHRYSEPPEQTPRRQTHTSFRSYSTSKSCVNDPEDSNFLICKERVNDGDNSYEKEERVPAHTSSSLFNPFSSYFNADQSDKLSQIYNHKQSLDDFDKAFLNIMSSPFLINPSILGSFSRQLPTLHPFNQNFPQNYSRQAHNTDNRRFPEGKSQNSKYYFSFKEEKDGGIKDI